MNRDPVKSVWKARVWRTALGATLSVLCLLAVFRFSPAPQGRAQDDAPDPPARVENVEIQSIRSRIDSTPANQLRNPTTANIPPQWFNSSETSATWTAGHSIVLIQGSMTGLPLTALDGASNPQPKAKWKVIRNPDDSPDLQQPPYQGDLTVNPTTGATTTLSLDKIGSFSVVAYTDQNAVYYNIVVCQVMYILDRSDSYPDRIATAFLTGFQLFVDSQPHDPCEGFGVRFGVQNNAGIELEAEIALAGGGPTGVLGVDRVFSGWTNVCSHWNERGTYANNHSAIVFLPNVDVPQFPPNYITAAALPNDQFPALNPGLTAAKPLLDAVDEHPATGGRTICMPGGETEVTAEFGQIRNAWATDYPNLPIASPHPKHANSHLTQYDAALDFTARLVVWTQAETGVRAGSTLYMCAFEVPWLCRCTYNQFNWGVTPHTCTEVTKSIALNNGTPHEPPVRIESLHGEVMPPVLNDRINLLDAHN